MYDTKDMTKKGLDKRISDLENTIGIEGDSEEIRSFQDLLSQIDDDYAEFINTMPELITLLHDIHRGGFWAGANYGKEVLEKLDRFIQDEHKDSRTESSKKDI